MTHTCQRCGVETPPGQEICPHCGAAIRETARTIRCKHCHRKTSSFLTVCPHCGRNLEPWRPYLSFSLLGIGLLVVAWLIFGGGFSLASKAASGLMALLPTPVTLTPLPLATQRIPITPTPSAVVAFRASPTAIIPTPTPTTQPRTATPTSTLPPTPTPTTGPTVYTVQAGDTLIGIANQFGISVKSLLDHNNITDPTALRAGQELRIPPPPTETPTPTLTSTPTTTPTVTPTSTPSLTATATPKATATRISGPTAKPTATPRTRTPTPTKTPTTRATRTPTTTPTGPITYTVQPGDTPIGIAIRFDVSVNALLAYNKISDPMALRVNQVLRIPPPDYVPPTPTPRPPTATPTPAPTPTPNIRLTAPVLQNPGNNASFQGADAFIVLSWENPGGVPGGIDNVVFIGVLVGPDEVDWRLTEAVGSANDFQVPRWLFGQAPQSYGRTYVWYVQAASVTEADGEIIDLAPVSPPSEQRRFLWN